VRIPGDLVLSPGGGEVYEILSYPLCRLYEDKTVPLELNGTLQGKIILFRFQPDMWEYAGKDKDRYLSYEASCIHSLVKIPFLITDRGLKKA
jgi:hypothetical protein